MTAEAFYSFEQAEHARAFFESLTLTKSTLSGRPEPMRLLPQNRRLVANLYGWRRADGRRLIRKVYYSVARKNTKTQTIAAIALKELLDPAESRPEIYIAAKDRDQASLCFDAAADMVRADEGLSDRLEIKPSYKTILDPVTGGKLKALSSEGRSKHGTNPTVVIFDEFHAWSESERELRDALTTGSGTRLEPLQIIITTAGDEQQSMCYREYEYAKRVLDGTVTDPTYLPVIYEVPPEADWTDESVWPLANPALECGLVKIETLREECERAKALPAYQNSFRRLYLNQWVNSQTQWIPLHQWDACGGDVDLEWLKQYPCYGGLDLAATRDLTAFVLAWPVDGMVYVMPWAFLPSEGLRERSTRDNVRYDVWADAGQIELTPGNATDWRRVVARIKALRDEGFDIREIAFDRYGARDTARELSDDGFTVVDMGQGWVSMSAPSKRLEQLVLERQIRHSGHPVLRWNIDCVTVDSDPAGNIKPVKPNGSQSNKRIDLVVAMVMALCRAMAAIEYAPGVLAIG